MSRGEIKLFKSRTGGESSRTGVCTCAYCGQTNTIEAQIVPAQPGVEQHLAGVLTQQPFQRQPAKPQKGKQLDFNDPL